MTTAEVADQHARRQVSLARRTAKELRRLWRQVERGRIAASWGALLPLALVTLGASQVKAAAAADPYLEDVLEASGVMAPATAQVAPGAFAGIASDGRPLGSLLMQPVFTTLEQIRLGVSPARAMASGGFVLDLISRTQVADAGRVAVGTAITSRPEVSGYVRMIVGKTCSRCLILAGRRYTWNQGFKRHPRCDCRHVPFAEVVPDDARVNPRAYFDSLGPAEQDELLGKAGAEAVRHGADMNKVVNARRGMQTASVFGRDVLVTTEGTTVRGDFGRARRDGRLLQRPGQRVRSTAQVRLMPEQILLEAHGSRDEAVRLLRLHGYIR